MNERRPLSRGFHPTGVLAMAAFGILAALLDIFVFDRPLRTYMIAAAIVVPLHLVQLWLDHRHSEAWYQLMTSPPYKPTFHENFRLRWPIMLCLPAMLIVGAVPIAAIFGACLALYYPWQRAMYDRSLREFGRRSNAP